MADHQLHLAREASRIRRVSARLGAAFPGALAATGAGAFALVMVGPEFGTAPAVAAALCLYGAGSALVLTALSRGYPHAEFGPANTVTLIRFALATILVAALIAPRETAPWAVPALAAVALALDGVDGWLARRTGLVSPFGARFDMEVDCVFALALALLVFESGKVGPWVLALGLARYAFWGASLAIPWMSGPLPERRSRKTVCVAQIVTLIALVSPALEAPLAPMLAAAMLGCVTWSFVVDIRHLGRSRR
jgi:phosphatidylglycerophosphate synthase